MPCRCMLTRTEGVLVRCPWLVSLLFNVSIPSQPVILTFIIASFISLQTDLKKWHRTEKCSKTMGDSLLMHVLLNRLLRQCILGYNINKKLTCITINVHNSA